MDQNQAAKAWYLSDTAFKALFYPLPAVFLDTNGSGMVRVDGRSQSVADAFTCPEFLMQAELLNLQENDVKKMRDEFAWLYDDYVRNEAEYSVGGGYRFGLISHYNGTLKGSPANWGHQTTVTIPIVSQLLVPFRTAQGAAAYAYSFGNPLVSRPSIVARIKQMVGEFGVQGLNSIHFQVLQGEDGAMSLCPCSVQNVYLLLYTPTAVNSEDDIFVSILVKSIVHLNRQLVHYRSTDPNNLAEASCVLPPDPDMCAYCGKASATRMYCSRCQILWYCSSECQMKHWKMKGPFCHKRECKLLLDSSVMKPAIPVGRLVMIHGLTSAAGQRLNGKDAFVVTPPNDNGRLGVVLEEDVSTEDAERLKMANVSWVPTTLQKAIKIENLELVWTETRI